jgi:hypothetical protein
MVQSGIYFGCSTGGNKFDSKLEGRRGWFTIFHVKVVKKVTCILRLGKGNSFLGLQYLEAKEIMQISPKFVISNFFLRLDFTWVKSLGSLPVRIRSST